MHAISSFEVVVTDPQTHTHTHTNRQDRLQYTAPQLARSVIIIIIISQFIPRKLAEAANAHLVDSSEKDTRIGLFCC